MHALLYTTADGRLSRNSEDCRKILHAWSPLGPGGVLFKGNGLGRLYLTKWELIHWGLIEVIGHS